MDVNTKKRKHTTKLNILFFVTFLLNLYGLLFLILKKTSITMATMNFNAPMILVLTLANIMSIITITKLLKVQYKYRIYITLLLLILIDILLIMMLSNVSLNFHA